jgi:hypothetical protein
VALGVLRASQSPLRSNGIGRRSVGVHLKSG